MRSILLGSITVWSLLALGGCEKTTVEGTAGRKLSVTKPSAVTVERGATAEVTVSIGRENLTEPVIARFDNLPEGVKVVDDGRKIEGSKATFVLEANQDAALVSKHQVKVTVEGPDGLSAAESFAVTIEEKS
jgi:hypothetical protein